MQPKERKNSKKELQHGTRTRTSSTRSCWPRRSSLFAGIVAVVLFINLILMVRFETVHRDAYDDSLKLSSPQKQPQTLTSTKSVARLAQMLIDAGDLDIPLSRIWDQHSTLYGSRPRIVGLEETCLARKDQQPIALAGLMNTNPNQLYDLLASNCVTNQQQDTIKWAVEWGRQAFLTQDMTKKGLSQIPVVIVRDPYTWLQTLCQHKAPGLNYEFKHCPHLAQHPATLHNQTFDNLLHLWNSYYESYYNLQKTHPRIILRYEDIQLYPKEIVSSLCACVGGQMKPVFDYHAHDNKDKGGLKDVFSAHFTSIQERRQKLTNKDFQTARATLSSPLLQSLGYVHNPGAFEEEHDEPVLTPEEIAQMATGKERLVELLQAAQIGITKRLLDALPTWQRVVDLYGPEPILHHLEDSCAKHDPQDLVFGISGMFNSGTNAMFAIVERNCPALGATKIKNRRIRWQVPWGKHELPTYKHKVSVVQKKEEVALERILPIVAVRDPYFWMQSMCRDSYEARWSKTTAHCPNLVVGSQLEQKKLDMWKRQQKDKYNTTIFEKEEPGLISDGDDNAVVVPMRLQQFRRTQMSFYDSLIDYWMAWYSTYRTWDEPRILLRVEDLVYHPKEVVSKLCACAGGKVEEPFEYQAAENMKADPVLHGYSNLLIRYADMEKRSHNMTAGDLKFAKERLETGDLMDYFGYRYHPTVGG